MNFLSHVESILGGRTTRQRERLSHTLYRLCEARQADEMASLAGGGTNATCAPRAARTRATTRKPASGGEDDDESAPCSLARPLFYDLPTVAEVISVSPRVVQALVREGSFPKPRALSAKRVGWLVSEIEQWAKARPVSVGLPPVNAGQRNAMRA